MCVAHSMPGDTDTAFLKGLISIDRYLYMAGRYTLVTEVVNTRLNADHFAQLQRGERICVRTQGCRLFIRPATTGDVLEHVAIAPTFGGAA